MHKKRILKFFRNTVSIALALSLMLGEAGTSIGTVYASGIAQTQKETEEAVSEETVNAASEYGKRLMLGWLSFSSHIVHNS